MRRIAIGVALCTALGGVAWLFSGLGDPPAAPESEPVPRAEDAITVRTPDSARVEPPARDENQESPHGELPAASRAIEALVQRREAIATEPFAPEYSAGGSPLDAYDAFLNAVDTRLDVSDAIEGDLLDLAQSADPNTRTEALLALADLYVDNSQVFAEGPSPEGLRPTASARFAEVVDEKVVVQEDKALMLYDILSSQTGAWPSDHPVHERIRTGRARIP